MNVTAMLIDQVQGHRRLNALWREARTELADGRRLVVTIKPEGRSTAQNSRMWVLLTAIAGQVDWHGQKLSAQEWKDVFSAALKRQKVVPGLEGGFVVLGSSTSRMTKAEMVEMQDLIEAFGAQHGVEFGEFVEPA